MKLILGLGILISVAVSAILWGWATTGLWIATLLSLATLSALLNGLRLLPDNQVIAILRGGAYERVEGPGLVLALPFIESFGPILDLWRVRREEFRVTHLPTRDKVYVEVKVTIYFRIDPRVVEDRVLASQAFYFSDEEWRNVLSDLIAVVLRDLIARLEVKALCDPTYLAWLQRGAELRLRDRARTYGMVLEPQRGVLIEAMRMPDSLQEAVVRARRLEVEAQAIVAFKEAVGPSPLPEALAVAILEDKRTPGVILPTLAVDLTGTDTEEERRAILWGQEISAKGGSYGTTDSGEH